MTTRQSTNNPPNIQLSTATDNEISTHVVSISEKTKTFPKRMIYLNEKILPLQCFVPLSLGESLFSLSQM